jgi:Mg2+ and Co2+ transporter CorA
MVMENMVLEKRVSKNEEKIGNLSKEVTENTVNMGYIQRIIDKFEKFTDECTQTLVNMRLEMKTFVNNQETLKQEVCEIKEKVEENEELNKFDLRKNQQNIYGSILGKIGVILTPLALIGLILYLLLGQ